MTGRFFKIAWYSPGTDKPVLKVSLCVCIAHEMDILHPQSLMAVFVHVVGAVHCGHLCISVYLWCGYFCQVGSKLREVLRNAKEVNEQRLYQDQKKVRVFPLLCVKCVP